MTGYFLTLDSLWPFRGSSTCTNASDSPSVMSSLFSAETAPEKLPKEGTFSDLEPSKRPNCYFDVTWTSPKGETEDWGRMEFKLYDTIVPRTAANFRALCYGWRKYQYNQSRFHRIIKGFMAQGGDIIYNNGTGGRSIYGHRFPDENFELSHDRRGLLSMANAGPNTNNSQFFILFGPARHLDEKHVVFGEIKKGLGILDKMEAVAKNRAGQTCGTVNIAASGVVEE